MPHNQSSVLPLFASQKTYSKPATSSTLYNISYDEIDLSIEKTCPCIYSRVKEETS